MSSENITLPSFATLCQSLNVPHPSSELGSLVQPNTGRIALLYTSPPVLVIGSNGYQCIQGPLNYDQQWLLQGRASGFVLKNLRPGNYCEMGKQPTEWAPEHDAVRCRINTSTSTEPGQSCFVWNVRRIHFSPSTDAPKAQGNFFRVYLHRPEGDNHSRIPVLSTVPFISADLTDIALGLPGVSIARILAKEPDILVNANSLRSVIPYPQSVNTTSTIKVEIKIIGYHKLALAVIPVECSHGILSHLGLAKSVAYVFRQLICQRDKENQPQCLSEMYMRLVALYLVDPSVEFAPAANKNEPASLVHQWVKP
ncbi:uncharacterized protein BT62DRAFT_1046595 [Guyanagaster necrorhizus]|uniref:Uncharacterized protein n=1 Tax=Guyanagaster necrorhizus TaxID=856835 RepID=A0A9P8AMS1_9AGAR|nr:uncharacterized protein BT62DRAFT_1046595 [Guyanagaster necrorhizus MCA 3950]KAG7441006.1 hypothetical protein BT62DRAFT_1046595 [Guyanagaster necrorhizus MCA 3950]